MFVFYQSLRAAFGAFSSGLHRSEEPLCDDMCWVVYRA